MGLATLREVEEDPEALLNHLDSHLAVKVHLSKSQRAQKRSGLQRFLDANQKFGDVSHQRIVDYPNQLGKVRKTLGAGSEIQ